MIQFFYGMTWMVLTMFNTNCQYLFWFIWVNGAHLWTMLGTMPRCWIRSAGSHFFFVWQFRWRADEQWWCRCWGWRSTSCGIRSQSGDIVDTLIADLEKADSEFDEATKEDISAKNKFDLWNQILPVSDEIKHANKDIDETKKGLTESTAA